MKNVTEGFTAGLRYENEDYDYVCSDLQTFSSLKEAEEFVMNYTYPDEFGSKPDFMYIWANGDFEKQYRSEYTREGCIMIEVDRWAY